MFTNFFREEIASCRVSLSHMDPRVCICRGGGWWLSDFDTWETCPYHFRKEIPHPEDDRDDPPYRVDSLTGHPIPRLSGKDFYDEIFSLMREGEIRDEPEVAFFAWFHFHNPDVVIEYIRGWSFD